MTVACFKWKIIVSNIAIRDGYGSPSTSKMELFVTIAYRWNPPVVKSLILHDSKRLDPAILNMILQLSRGLFPLLNSSWIQLDCFFCQRKLIFWSLKVISGVKFFILIYQSSLECSVLFLQNPILKDNLW